MKKLIILAVVAVSAAFCEAAPRKAAAMPVDESGWRCEGDCDPDTPCRFCNPPPKAKKAAKAKRGGSSARKRSAKRGEKSAAKKQRKRSSKPRKSSRKAVEE